MNIDEAHKKMNEHIKNNVEPQIVNCFGGRDFKILGETFEHRTDQEGKPYKIRYLIINMYNDKIDQWQEEKVVEHYGACPICGALLLVRAVKGTTYFYACKEHTKQAWGEFQERQKKYTIPE